MSDLVNNEQIQNSLKNAVAFVENIEFESLLEILRDYF